MMARIIKGQYSSSGPSSGVGVNDECIQAFQELKLRHMWRYVIYRITDDNRRIVVDEKAGKDKDYTDFVEALKLAEKQGQCRYGIFDLEYLYNHMPRQKLIFFLWSPDCAKLRQKMLYSSSKDSLRSKLIGVSVEIQSTDDFELAYSSVLEKCLDRFQ